jgi:hypothetical protein
MMSEIEDWQVGDDGEGEDEDERAPRPRVTNCAEVPIHKRLGSHRARRVRPTSRAWCTRGAR